MKTIQVIISGGQTGADRAALDFALKHHFKVEGYCPRGRKANDGILDIKYSLQETASSAYPPRTRKNVLLADGTVIFNGTPKLSSGSHATIKYARMHYKRYKILKGFPNIEKDVTALKLWLQANPCTSLNVAGNSEEKCPGMYRHVFAVLLKSLL